MLRFVVLTSLLASVLAGNYGSYGGVYGGSGFSSMSMGSGLKSFGSSMGSFGSSMGSFGSSMGSGSMGSFGMGSLGLKDSFAMGSMGSMGSYGSSSFSGGVIPAAIQSRRTIQFVDMPSTLSAPIPLTIAVPASQQPINFLMKSQSSPLNLETAHEATPGSFQESSSMDEPQVRLHTVTRPVVQKINEIVMPYRKIQQEVNPVQEDVTSIISKGSGYTAGYGTAGYAAAPLLATGYTGTTGFTGATGFSKFAMAKPSYAGSAFGSSSFQMTSMPKPTAAEY